MDKLLKRIENSEKNNPLLKAALEEVERLNKQIDEIRCIVDCITMQESVDYGPLETISGDRLNQAKIDVIIGMLC